jgi:uncharacterized phiE125 gp8 family phage protein
MALRLETAPAIEPITLADLKNDIKVDSDLEFDDLLIGSLLTAARKWVENTARRALVTQSWALWLDDWPADDWIAVPRPPIQSVDSIKYYDNSDNEYTLSSSVYQVDTISEPGRVVLRSGQAWPSSIELRPANAVAVNFTAGYGGDETAIPEEYKQAIRLLVGHWYENRGAVASTGAVPKEVPFGVMALLWQDRVF